MVYWRPFLSHLPGLLWLVAALPRAAFLVLTKEYVGLLLPPFGKINGLRPVLA
jgi:hypothetical protein